MSSTRGGKTVKTDTSVLADTTPTTTEKDNSVWTFETHIHDHDGCYDLLHCTAGKNIGQYKRKMFNEGNFLINNDLQCKKEGSN